MKTEDIFLTAIGQALRMVMELVTEYSRSDRMSPDEARAASARILANVLSDEAEERRQFEYLRAMHPPGNDDSQG